MLVRPTSGGIRVLIDTKRLPLLRERVTDNGHALCMGFQVRSTDPHFDEYTAPAARSAEVLCFDSRQAGALDAGRRMLHATPRISDQCFMPVNAPGVASMLTGVGQPRLPLALIQMVLTDASDGLCADALAPELRRFGLRFGASAVYWKYYLLGTLGTRPLFISDLDNAVTFRQLESIDFPGAGMAGVFLSQDPIALRDMPGQRFQLVERAGFGDRVVIKRMSNARVGHRQREVVDGQAVLVSEIFINH